VLIYKDVYKDYKLACPNISYFIIYDYKTNKIRLSPCCELIDIYKEFDVQYFIDNLEEIFKNYKEERNKIIEKKCLPDKAFYINLNYSENKIQEAINLSIDSACNINCKFCSYAKDRKNQSKDESEKRIQVSNEILKKMLSIHFAQSSEFIFRSTGIGEPFFNNYFKNEWLFNVKKENFNSIRIISNVNCVDTNYLKKLKCYTDENKIDIKITASFDGVNKENYERIMMGANFEKAVENILFLNKNNMLDSINYSITSESVNEFKKYNIIDEFKKLGFEGATLFLMKETRFDKKTNEINILYDEFINKYNGNSFIKIS
jgi:hypothetical protein